jgi:cobalt-zinc-cadmium efflux system outer membrane protein
VEASLAQNIADLWQIPVRKRGGEHALHQAILRLARQASDLAAKTKTAYHRATGADRTYAIAQENLTVANQLLETAIARREAGAGSDLDVNLARSSVLESELSLETDRLDRAEARRELARLLGLTGNAEDLLLMNALPETNPMSLDAERMIEAARQCRLDILAARENVAMAAAIVEQERLGVVPVLNVGVALERGERRSGDPKEPTDFIIGPAIDTTIPVFDQNQAQIAKAMYAHQQALHLLEALDRQMIQDVRSAADRAHTAWELSRLANQQFVPLAQKNLDLSQESYRAGKTSVLSVLEAQRFLLQSRRRSVAALVTAASATFQVEHVVGQPLEAIVTDANPLKQRIQHDTQPTSGD